jgi:hypothetical protein
VAIRELTKGCHGIVINNTGEELQAEGQDKQEGHYDNYPK